MGSNILFLVDHKTGYNLIVKLTEHINKYIPNRVKWKSFYAFFRNYNSKQKYVIITRDPREVIISGYLYHKRCTETWCCSKKEYYYSYWDTNHFTQQSVLENLDFIRRAKVFSENVCYQNKLNSLSEEEGIIYEMKNVAYLTNMGMYSLEHYGKANVLIIKFEDLIFDLENVITRICSFINMSAYETKILEDASKDNILKLKERNITLLHTTNINVEKDRYKKYWSPRIQQEFEETYPRNILTKLDYK